MKGLIIVAHGSRTLAANEQIRELTEKVAASKHIGTDLVVHAFLELATPSIAQASQKLVKLGCSTVELYPLFLTNGKHVTRDIPEIIEQLSTSYPDIDFVLRPSFSDFVSLGDIIIEHLVMTDPRPNLYKEVVYRLH